MTWQSKTTNLREKIGHLRNSRDMSDVTIIVGKEKQQFRTHKWLLSMYSEEFHDMFYGPSATTSKEIALEDDNADIFDIFFRYVYTDDLEINSSVQAFSALMFANKYRVIQMKDKCVKLVAESVPSNIIFEIFEASTSLAPKLWRKSSNNENKSSNTRIYSRENHNPIVNITEESSEHSIEEETSTEHLTQSLPAMNQDSYQSYSNPIKSVGKMNQFAKDLTMSLPVISECTCQSNIYPIQDEKLYKIKGTNRRPKYCVDVSEFLKENWFTGENIENVLELSTEKDINSEADLHAALLKWGRQFQRNVNPELFRNFRDIRLHVQFDELKEEKNENSRTEQNMKLLNFPSNCSKSWISSTSFPYIKERFRSRELDLYIYGVTLILKCNSNDGIKETPIVKLKISNLTKNVNSSKKISVLFDRSERPISLKLLDPILVGKGEVCEIVLKGKSNVKNGQYTYCGEICCLDQRLDRLDNCSAESERVGHFNSIIAISL